MKRYATLRCSICARQKDELLDLTHYLPDRCTITLGCEGRLSPVGFTSDGTSSLDVPPVGLSNWRPRGASVEEQVQLQSDVLYDTSTGSKQQIIIAVSDDAVGSVPSNSATLTLNLVAEQQTAKDYRQYTFRRTSSFDVINGVEDAQAKKVLRYSITGVNPDVVEVYVNGIKRVQGSNPENYKLYDGTTGTEVPPNSVLFNSTIVGTNTQIDVIVTKAATISNATMTFNRMVDDEARIMTGAWEGIDAVSSPAIGRWSLFYCDFSTISSSFVTGIKLQLNTTSPAVLIDGGPPITVQASSMAMLLSRVKLYTQLDRQRASWILLNELAVGYLLVKLIKSVKALLITEISVTDLFPVLEVIRFNPPALQRANLSGDSEAKQLNNIMILGPDA